MKELEPAEIINAGVPVRILTETGAAVYLFMLNDPLETSVFNWYYSAKMSGVPIERWANVYCYAGSLNNWYAKSIQVLNPDMSQVSRYKFPDVVIAKRGIPRRPDAITQAIWRKYSISQCVYDTEMQFQNINGLLAFFSNCRLCLEGKVPEDISAKFNNENTEE